MGEAKRRWLNGTHLPPMAQGANVLVKTKSIRFVSNIRLENTDDSTVMILGENAPELGVTFRPAEARKLAEALIAHAAELEQKASRIILPGQGLRAV